jgi:phosphinothricin acetyltransferase
MSGERCSLRLATLDDAAAVHVIYAPYVIDTPITFETEVPTLADITQRIETTLASYPWLVCVRDGDIVGYAYGGPYRTRAAYRWSVEVTVYVRNDARRTGVGRALYTTLLDLVRWQGFFNAFAMITIPNPGSIRLHESFGFTPAGVTRRVGFKLGHWHDVGTWELALRLPSIPTGPPTLPEAIYDTPEWRHAFVNGAACLASARR